MSKIFLDIINIIAGMALGLWWFSVIFLPLFYGIPRATYYALKGVVKGRAILFYCLSLVIILLPIKN